MAAFNLNLAQFSEDQLLAVKIDLEQRLARFQRAFFEKHGRNPNDIEREPAKPAIKRYRLICHELAKREAAKKDEHREPRTLSSTGAHHGPWRKTELNGLEDRRRARS